MSKKSKLLDRSNYLLARYQNEIYRQLADYMGKNDLSQRDIAKALDVSDAYVSQVLNGEFNFTLKKLIELSLLIGKAPVISFVDKDEYWLLREKGQQHLTFTMSVEKTLLTDVQLDKIKAGALKLVENKPESTVTFTNEPVNMEHICLQ